MSGYRSIKGDKIMGGSFPDEAVDAKLCDLLNEYFQQFLDLTSNVNCVESENNEHLKEEFDEIWNKISKLNFLQFELENLKLEMFMKKYEYDNLFLKGRVHTSNKFYYYSLSENPSQEKLDYILCIVNSIIVSIYYFLCHHLIFKFDEKYESDWGFSNKVFREFCYLNIILNSHNVKKHLESKINFDIKSFYKYELYSSKSISECK